MPKEKLRPNTHFDGLAGRVNIGGLQTPSKQPQLVTKQSRSDHQRSRRERGRGRRRPPPPDIKPRISNLPLPPPLGVMVLLPPTLPFYVPLFLPLPPSRSPRANLAPPLPTTFFKSLQTSGWSRKGVTTTVGISLLALFPRSNLGGGVSFSCWRQITRQVL